MLKFLHLNSHGLLSRVLTFEIVLRIYQVVEQEGKQIKIALILPTSTNGLVSHTTFTGNPSVDNRLIFH